MNPVSVILTGPGPLPDEIERRLQEAGALVTRYRETGRLPLQELEHVSVLVIAADGDAANMDLALEAKRSRPGLPIVVRIFDKALASYLAETEERVTVVSMSRVAGPVFADAALRVLAGRRDEPPRLESPRPGQRRRGFRVDRVLLYSMMALFVLVFPSALLFSHVLDLRYIDALYFVWTTVMTVGYGDIALKDAPDGVKLFGMALMLAGAAFIAVLFALLSDFVMSRRLDVLRGRTRERGSGHVIIVGAGNVGFRIAELLAARGCRLVIVERDPQSRNAAALRAAGHHVITADAMNEEMADLAGLAKAALVLAVTDVDAVNLQIALHARGAGVPVIMRVVSSELSAHVSGRGDWTAISPIHSAADAFTQASLKAAAAP
jgi:voltage-gated potassium channel Kch